MAKNFRLITTDQDNIEELIKSESKLGFQIVSYHVQMDRSRTESGTPYGPALMKKAEIVVKLEYNKDASVLYRYLANGGSYNFIVMHGAEMLFYMAGYVADIEEFYSSSPEERTSSQLLAKISLLVSEITYRGTDKTQETKAIFE